MATVLIIEDEPYILENILETLTLEGYHAIGANNAAAGLKLVDVHLPDLILCDVAMPEQDGFVVLEEVRTNPRTNHIPFIFLSARADIATKQHGIHMGANDYLTKPFAPAMLIEIVGSYLSG